MAGFIGYRVTGVHSLEVSGFRVEGFWASRGTQSPGLRVLRFRAFRVIIL